MRKLKLNTSLNYYNTQTGVTNTRVDFQINGAIVVGQTYSITVNIIGGASTTFNYVALIGDTAIDILSNLVGQIVAFYTPTYLVDGHAVLPNNNNYCLLFGLPYTTGFTVGSSGSITRIRNNTIFGVLSLMTSYLTYAQSKGFTGIQLYGLYGILSGIGGTGYYDNSIAYFNNMAYTGFGMVNVGAILGNGTTGLDAAYDFSMARGVATEQFNEYNKESEFWFGQTVYFTVNSTAAGTYRITINGQDFIVTSGGAMTTAQIASAFVVLMGGLAGFTVTLNGSVVEVQIAGLSAFTYSSTANVSAGLISEDFQSWVDSLIYFRPKANAEGWIVTAYVANPTNSWMEDQARYMIEFGALDAYESTNYRPNYVNAYNAATHRARQLYYISEVLFDMSPLFTLNFYPIFSAETAFFGNQVLVAGSLAPMEADWQARWVADVGLLGKAWMLRGATDFCWFDLNNLSRVLP